MYKTLFVVALTMTVCISSNGHSLFLQNDEDIDKIFSVGALGHANTTETVKKKSTVNLPYVNYETFLNGEETLSIFAENGKLKLDIQIPTDNPQAIDRYRIILKNGTLTYQK